MSLKVNNSKLIESPTEALNLPNGTVLQRPASLSYGMMRYNTESDLVEVYTPNSWRSLAFASAAPSIGPGNGSIYSWGTNESGETLQPAGMSSTEAVKSSYTFNYKKIVTSVAGNTTFVIKDDQTLWSVGNNRYGQLGKGDNINRNTLTQVTLETSASGLPIESTVNTWIDISCFGDHVAGIKTDFTLWTWGRNNYGQLAQGDFIDYSAPNKVGSVADWISVACGESHTVAIRKSTAALWAAGLNIYGQLGTNSNINTAIMTASASTLTGWGAVQCGALSSYAVNNDGYIYSWGYNNNGELGHSSPSIVLGPTKISTLANMAAGNFSVGKSHVLAVTPAGYLYSWGLNTYGQLGLGDTTTKTVPTRVGTGTNWWNLSAGADHSMATTNDGILYVSGKNSEGQLGLGDYTNRSSFEQSSSIYWNKLLAGSNHSLGLEFSASTDYGGKSFTSSTTWQVPAGINYICVAAVGRGGSSYGSSLSTTGGGGGAAAYANLIPVATNETITITINSTESSMSLVRNGSLTKIVIAYSGGIGSPGITAPGGTYTINPTYISGTYGGFNGGSSGSPGTGVGYVGSGGGGGSSGAVGGAGAWGSVIPNSGGASTGSGGGGGGGGGNLGAGNRGTAGGQGDGTYNHGGSGGSLGGGAGMGWQLAGSSGPGAVRIIWGSGRSFPSFQTEKLGSEV